MKNFLVILTIVIVLILGVGCIIVLTSEDPYLEPIITSSLNTGDENIYTSTSVNVKDDTDITSEISSTPGIIEEREVIATDKLGKDIIGTEYDDGCYVVSGTGDMYSYSAGTGEIFSFDGDDSIKKC